MSSMVISPLKSTEAKSWVDPSIVILKLPVDIELRTEGEPVFPQAAYPGVAVEVCTVVGHSADS